jgi:hypothetical protein
MTSAGQLQIRFVEVVTPETISEGDATRAGFTSKDALLTALDRRTDGLIYRIEFGPLGADPRIALREARPDEAAIAALRNRLARLDAAAGDGPWTLRTLQLLNEHPGVRAADLCVSLGQERLHFKRNVRKLKSHGLTESLARGYRLSPRGKSLLDQLESPANHQ